jgi:nucleoside-diphosphate-sugar epimerase
MEIRGLSALVTSASGFIGGRLAERLAAEEGACPCHGPNSHTCYSFSESEI